ncbi:hypothetical protein EXU48_11625 [Occultella glacieicola]|uniref:DNA-binding protein n=1 Tax=Occultella glacieicola TaxID=2518684 RepID=A0ABY2E386_9MICO|nr:hypothetical protein [Occultella glacieicola]TDE94092.1 hypothetical protein EXU48_11625 [Occultella glacieicola]
MTAFHSPEIEAAADRHGLDTDAFLAALDDLVNSTATATQTEKDYLLTHGGIGPETLTPHAQAHALRVIEVATEAADRDATEQGISTADVAARYSYQKSNISRMVANRDLYALKQARGAGSVFPSWQFTDTGPLPGLRHVLPEFPDDYHPLDIAAFMTTPTDGLEGRTPRGWLATGGDPARVASLVAELAIA